MHCLLSSFSSIWRLLAFCLLCLVIRQVQAQIYISGVGDSHWTAKSGPFACSLTHKVPGYGEAIFSRKAGGAEAFELLQSQVTFPLGGISIEAIPPNWRSDLSPVPLGQVQSVQGKTAVRLSPMEFSPIMSWLDKGMRVIFSSNKASDTGAILRIGLEPQRFPSAYKTYQRCITQLIPYSFQQVSRTTITYGSNAEVLSAAAKARLDKMIRYAKADSRVLGVIVDGHSDKLIDPATGELASKTQAELAVAYLVEKGIPADKITARWHGDKFPIASNLTSAGKAQNRRVTVRLENADSRRETEEKIAARKAAEEKLAANKAAEEKRAADELAAQTPTLKRLVELVEGQNLTSGKQPELTGNSSAAP